MTESLTAKSINMLEKAREEHTFTTHGHKMVRLCFSIKMQTKLKLIIFNSFFFFGNEPDQLWREKCVVSTVILLRIFLLVVVFFTS